MRPPAMRRQRLYVVVAALASLAITLAAHGTALAVAGPLLTSTWVETLPAGPDSPEWKRVKAIYVPLTPQVVALPRLAQPSVSTLVVRSVNNGEQIAFYLEWRDPTRDVRATRPDEFRDAAAILLPVAAALGNVCMGSPGQLTNLWHWKADWQEDLDRGFQDVRDAYPNFYKDDYPFATGQPPFRAPADFASPEARLYAPGLAAGNPLSQPRRSPVEELLANGFGTTSHKAVQTVGGQGIWAESPGGGRWQVMFVRSMAASDGESVNLAGQSETAVAFAVWNGANQEVGARKQLSSLVTMRIQRSPAEARQQVLDRWLSQLNTPPTYFFLGFSALVAAAALAGSWARRRASRHGSAAAAGSAPPLQGGD